MSHSELIPIPPIDSACDPVNSIDDLREHPLQLVLFDLLGERADRLDERDARGHERRELPGHHRDVADAHPPEHRAQLERLSPSGARFDLFLRARQKDALALEGRAVTPAPAIVINFRSFDMICGEPVRCAVTVSDSGLQQGQGMHGSFSRADTLNSMAAIGPDFKKGFVDDAPVSNADIARTLAHILKLDLPHKGELTGRVIEEALAQGPASMQFTRNLVESQQGASGEKTSLAYQLVGQIRYFDAAGFPGRTVGLPK